MNEVNARRAAELGDAARPLYLPSDEPYRAFAYDGAVVPPVMPLTPYAVVLGSFSKTPLAGERIGYVAVNPAMPDGATLVNAITLTNRTLGFVNAPVIGQRLAAQLLDQTVDLGVYDRRRRQMAQVTTDAGIAFTMPKGRFTSSRRRRAATISRSWTRSSGSSSSRCRGAASAWPATSASRAAWTRRSSPVPPRASSAP